MSQFKQMLHKLDGEIQFSLLEYAPILAKSLFSNVKDRKWSMLLDSNNSQHIDSRFDILVAEPLLTVETVGTITTLKSQDQAETTTQPALDVLSDLIGSFVPSSKLPEFIQQQDIPFIGGAVGLWGYDLGRQLENLPNSSISDLKTPDMAVGFYEWALVVDHHLKNAYLVGQNLKKATEILIAPSESDGDIITSPEGFKLTSDWQSNLTLEAYQNKFEAIHEYLLSGDCYQINLAQRFDACYEGDVWHAFEKLNHANQAPFSAYLSLPGSTILSVSPERFIKLNDKQIETKPIKGTRPRGSSEKMESELIHSLKSSEKDRAENLMIVDLLRNDIGRVAKPGTVSVPKLFDVETFPAVHHLVSTIHAELDTQFQAVDLLKASFPGGSITGAPKVRAMEIIEELEPHRRNAYCGSIGYISRHGNMDTSITIRTLVAEQGKIYAWAGGGIVADSHCEDEYQETLDKLSKILPVL